MKAMKKSVHEATEKDYERGRVLLSEYGNKQELGQHQPPEKGSGRSNLS